MTPDQEARYNQALELLDGIPLGNIRNLANFIQSLPDLSPFNDCFPGAVRMTDVDGMVECRGKGCLYIEHKLGDTAENAGQIRAFEGWANQGNFTMVVWSSTGDLATTTRIKLYGPGFPPIEMRSSLDAALTFAKTWWRNTAKGLWP